MQRSIDIGQVINRAVGAYGAQAGLILPAALTLFVPVALLEGLLGTDESAGLPIVFLAVPIIPIFWFQGRVGGGVPDIQAGRRDMTLGDLLRAPAPVLGTLIAAGLVAGIGV